ncbi:hypothetical protein F5Y01DRAFT_293389 [Xylaria sp. FL0043]|nr:hypothetical protein F5Y01DRAFT_293389 [Xylaria sp. FL0043]
MNVQCITRLHPYRKPFVKLGVRPILLFRCGTSMPVPLRLTLSSASNPFLIELTLLPLLSNAGVPNRTLPPFTLPFSIRKCFHPSNSRSRRKAFSFSCRNSRSARRAASWLELSLAWSSSMVLRSFSTLSRNLETSSFNCVACLSLRSICDCKSLTTRSTLRTDLWDLDRSSS